MICWSPIILYIVVVLMHFRQYKTNGIFNSLLEEIMFIAVPSSLIQWSSFCLRRSAARFVWYVLWYISTVTFLQNLQWIFIINSESNYWNWPMCYCRAPDKLHFCVIMQIKLTKTQFFYFLCVVEPNSIRYNPILRLMSAYFTHSFYVVA